MVHPHPTRPGRRRRRGHVDLVTQAARDALTVRRAFGEPVRHGEVTVVPVARVRGGSGIGFGSGALDAARDAPGRPSSERGTGEEHTDRGASGDGGGGGFGVSVRPLGVMVVRGDDARWRPTVDATMVILAGQAVGALAVVSVARLLRQRTAHAAAVCPPVAGRRHLLPRLPIRALGRLALAGPRLLLRRARRPGG